MAVVGILIVLMLVARYGVHVWLSGLNAASAEQPLPASLQPVYGEKDLAKARAYAKARSLFGRIDGAWELGCLLIFWGLGGWAWLHGIAEGIHESPVIKGTLFLLFCGGAGWLAGLPTAAVSTFGLEEAFGFNRTTPKVFVMDQIKTVILGTVLFGLLGLVVVWLFVKLGGWAWLAAWAAVFGFTLLLQAVAPVWLAPLFYKFTPLGEGELRTAVEGYAARVGFPIQGVYEMDGSTRSTNVNAWIGGSGKFRRIALFDTLMEKLSNDETVAVVAHEVGHWHHRHIRKRVTAAGLQTFVFFGIMGLVLPWQGTYELMGVAGDVAVGMVFFMIVSGPISELLSPLTSGISRKHEYEADAYAAETADGGALITALHKLGVENAANPTPHPLYVKAFYSHPPLAERLAALTAATEK
jgi:STE24 endopeptidase